MQLEINERNSIIDAIKVFSSRNGKLTIKESDSCCDLIDIVRRNIKESAHRATSDKD